MINVFCVAAYITHEVLKLSGCLKLTDLRKNISFNVVLSSEVLGISRGWKNLRRKLV
jgi:hypothetical protein